MADQKKVMIDSVAGQEKGPLPLPGEADKTGVELESDSGRAEDDAASAAEDEERRLAELEAAVDAVDSRLRERISELEASGRTKKAGIDERCKRDKKKIDDETAREREALREAASAEKERVREQGRQPPSGSGDALMAAPPLASPLTSPEASESASPDVEPALASADSVAATESSSSQKNALQPEAVALESRSEL